MAASAETHGSFCTTNQGEGEGRVEITGREWMFGIEPAYVVFEVSIAGRIVKSRS